MVSRHVGYIAVSDRLCRMCQVPGAMWCQFIQDMDSELMSASA